MAGCAQPSHPFRGTQCLVTAVTYRHSSLVPFMQSRQSFILFLFYSQQYGCAVRINFVLFADHERIEPSASFAPISYLGLG